MSTLVVLIVVGAILLLLPWEPYYRGRPVSDWAVDYSKQLYPSGTAPLSASQRGVEALRKMGPQKAATALVHALMRSDSKFYERYRSVYPRFPAWYRKQFPLKLTHQQKVTLVLGAIEFFDPQYRRAVVPFVITYLEKPDPPAQLAACELLANMPEAAGPALPVLERLATSAEPAVSEAAHSATSRIVALKRNPE